jgi:SAM-dependent methyltransferase
LPHVAPGGFKNSILFYLRLFFDISVLTTYRDIRKYLQTTKNNVLEVGSGLKPYRNLVPKDVDYHAIDWKGASDHFHYNDADTTYYDGNTFPIKDSSFDYLFHTEVLEHVYDIRQFLKECHRVLSNKGKMFFTIPFAARNHYIPYDYWRLTPAAIEKLLGDAGFANVNIKPRGNDLIVAITKINILIVRTIMHDIHNPVIRMLNKIILGLIFVIPWVTLTVLEHIVLFLKVGSSDDPLGYSVYCEKR